MTKTIIKNGKLVNEGRIFAADILLEGDRIARIEERGFSDSGNHSGAKIINAEGKYIFPGIIDSQVHFREPGLTHKDDLYSASRSAVSGGVTSFMEMPNTNPQTLTQELLEEKFQIASQKSLANFSFFMGTSNSNRDEVLRTDPERVCGIKIFMGASTGNMLVDDPQTLRSIFSQNHPNLPISLHCEDEKTIQENTAKFREKYGEEVPIEYHPAIRSEEACYKSSSFAVALAKEFNTRIHVLHLTTGKEMELFTPGGNLREKRITAEVCVHHLWFSEEDYLKKGTWVKWNPAIKKSSDRDALFQALLDNRLDVVATDHSPHTVEEKANSYFKAPSGGPLVAHSLAVMMEFAHRGKISVERVVEKMCHAPAELFRVRERGYLREGYYADIAIVNPKSTWVVSPANINYKCGYSPFEGTEFHSRVETTFVNGNCVYHLGEWFESARGSRLLFDRN